MRIICVKMDWCTGELTWNHPQIDLVERCNWTWDGMVWSIVFTLEDFTLKRNVHVWQQCLTFFQRRLLNMTEDIMTAVRGNLSQTTGASGQEDSGQTAPINGAIPSSAAELSEDSSSCTGELTRTWLQFAKTFVIIFPIYVLGYFEFSFSWLLIALTIFFFWKRNTKCKNTRLNRALSFFEQEAVKQELEATELPSWVS